MAAAAFFSIQLAEGLSIFQPIRFEQARFPDTVREMSLHSSPEENMRE